MKRKTLAIWGIVCAFILCVGAIYYAAAQDTAKADDCCAKKTVTDTTGAEVELPRRPARVVVLNASNLDLYVAAGGAKSIVGKPTSEALSDEVKQATSEAEQVGIIHSPDVEKILALQPDLVIGTNVPFHTDLRTTLAGAGIPLLIQAQDSLADLYGALELYGTLTGEEERADARIRDIEEKVDETRARAAGRTAPKSLIVFGTPDSFNMGTKKCFAGGLVDWLGGGNIADAAGGDGAYLPISMEFVARENPSVILLIMHGPAGSIEGKVRQDLKENEAWQDIDAVREGRVYVLPYELFAVNPGTRAADALAVVADKLYPAKEGRSD